MKHVPPAKFSLQSSWKVLSCNMRSSRFQVRNRGSCSAARAVRSLDPNQPVSRIQNFHQPGCCCPLYLRNLKTRMKTRVAKTIVDAIDTIDVKLVIVETWHPSGRVLISHLSDQCGQMSSSYAGASAGMV